MKAHFDTLVEIKKIGGKNGNPDHSGVPVGRFNRGFLTQDCVDEDGMPRIGDRVELAGGKLSTSPLQTITFDEKLSTYILETNSGKYHMKIVRKNKLRQSV